MNFVKPISVLSLLVLSANSFAAANVTATGGKVIIPSDQTSGVPLFDGGRNKRNGTTLVPAGTPFEMGARNTNGWFWRTRMQFTQKGVNASIYLPNHRRIDNFSEFYVYGSETVDKDGYELPQSVDISGLITYDYLYRTNYEYNTSCYYQGFCYYYAYGSDGYRHLYSTYGCPGTERIRNVYDVYRKWFYVGFFDYNNDYANRGLFQKNFGKRVDLVNYYTVDSCSPSGRYFRQGTTSTGSVPAIPEGEQFTTKNPASGSGYNEIRTPDGTIYTQHPEFVNKNWSRQNSEQARQDANYIMNALRNVPKPAR